MHVSNPHALPLYNSFIRSPPLFFYMKNTHTCTASPPPLFPPHHTEQRQRKFSSRKRKEKMPTESVTIVSKSTILPNTKSSIGSLRLSVSDLPMLTCQYIQKGCLFTTPSIPIESLISSLKLSLSLTLPHFPAFAGRLSSDPSTGYVSILCNDAGIEFVHARAPHVLLRHILSPLDVPPVVRRFFTFDDTISYDGHFKPIAAVQVTELGDGLFVGLIVNHAVVDGTSLWHFFNSFAEVTKSGAEVISRSPDFSRDTVFNTQAVLRFPDGGPKPTFSGNEPLRERIFHFSRESISELKKRANSYFGTGNNKSLSNGAICRESTEALAKESNDDLRVRSANKEIAETNGVGGDRKRRTTIFPAEISSFQSLSAQLWRSVTRARNLAPTKTTTFRMAVNCRHRVSPKMDPYYFGNAIQSIPTVASVDDILSKSLGWCADLLHQNVVRHDDRTVRDGVEAWERDPRCFPLGNFDGAMITMGSSPRFPMYNNDLGWGQPIAIRSGKANKFDGKISAFPGKEGNGSVDLEVLLAPETMAGLETDMEFMQYVSNH